MPLKSLHGRALVNGTACGELMVSDIGLSFWGGVDPTTGIVIDQHHPWRDRCLSGKILVLPSSRGSCSGSGVVPELLLNGVAPAAFVFSEPEEIITFGVLVATTMYGCKSPVVRIDAKNFSNFASGQWASIEELVKSVLVTYPSLADWRNWCHRVTI